MKCFCDCCDSSNFCNLGLKNTPQNSAFTKPVAEGCCDAVHIDNNKGFFIEFKNIDKFINEGVPQVIRKVKKQLENAAVKNETDVSEKNFFLAYDINKNIHSETERDEYNLFRLEIFQIVPQANAAGIRAARCEDVYYILQGEYNLNI